MQKEKTKTPDEIKKQDYISIKELMILVPNLTYDRARLYINEVREEMRKEGYCIPITRPKLALTKLIKKKFGL